MHAIVIGGTSGFGKNISSALQQTGYTVTTTGRTGGDFIADVGDEQQWTETIKTISADREPAMVVVFVVGYARAKKEGHDESSWDEHEQKNVGYVRQALEHLKLADHARIITIGSQWSWKSGIRALAPYIEGKHALRELTKKFSAEHPELSVCHMCPPTMQTAQLEKVTEGGYTPPNQIADPSIIAEAMVNEFLAKNFHGETLQFSTEGKMTLIKDSEIQTEPRYSKPSRK